MRKFFQKDHLITGIIIGFVTTSLLYFLMDVIIDMLEVIPVWLKNPRTPFLIALIPNLFIFRYFMVNRKQDKTGRGLLLTIFIVVFAVFLFIK
ncbi:MAG: hypothetical protein FD155_1221 [Bacteroidetes bacterium]|nr:MAG: hypothetical protein FD155_1221 [Bacteroidota bacterium]